MEPFMRVSLCAVSFVVLLISSILLGVSFDTLEPTQVGVRFNANTQHIDTSTLYGEGRYLVGLGQSFIKFPSTVITVAYGIDNIAEGIEARTRDGMIVRLSIAWHARLNLNVQDLVRLYMDFGPEYAAEFSRIGRGVLRDAASKYETMQYFSSRVEISQEMLRSLDVAVSNYYASAVAIQLVNMDMIENFTIAIENTNVAAQDSEQAQYEQSVARVRTDAEIRVAEEKAQIVIRRANATAEADIAKARAEATAFLERTRLQAQALQELRTNVSLSTNQELLDYLWLLTLQESASKSVVLNYDTPRYIA